MNRKSIVAFLAISGFSVGAQSNGYDYSGAVIAHSHNNNRVEIDYQLYSINLDTVIQGNTLRGEYGAKLRAGQQVEFNTVPSTDGPPLITQLRIITDTGDS